MDLRTYLHVLRKNWWLILVCAILGVAGGYFVTATTTPVYASRVTFYVSTPTEASGQNAYQANQYALSKISSFAELLVSDELAKRVIAESGLALSPRQVAQRISSTAEDNTVLLTASVTDTDPKRSLAIATALATEFGPFVDSLDNRTVDGGQTDATVQLRVTSGPTLQTSPISPNRKVDLALGFALGVVAGLMFALLRELLDTSVRTAAALANSTGAPVLGVFKRDRRVRANPILGAARASRSIRAEAFRQLRTALQFVDIKDPVHVLAVTSALPGEGKSSTSINLALVFAETGRQCLLLEADLRRPRISDYLGIPNSRGLTDVLVGQSRLEDVIQSWGESDLHVLPSGTLPPSPSELLGSAQMSSLLSSLRQSYDIIVVDTPPVLPVTDTAVISSIVDGTLVVVRAGKTSKAQLAATMATLLNVDARIVGTVLNGTHRRRFGDDARGDSYGYYDKGKVSTLSPEQSAVTLPAGTHAAGPASRTASDNSDAERPTARTDSEFTVVDPASDSAAATAGEDIDASDADVSPESDLVAAAGGDTEVQPEPDQSAVGRLSRAGRGRGDADQ